MPFPLRFLGMSRPSVAPVIELRPGASRPAGRGAEPRRQAGPDAPAPYEPAPCAPIRTVVDPREIHLA